MKIEILDEAQEDLVDGFRFYEAREAGLGSYFLDCLFSDIDSLLLYAGIHQII
ncbi:MAG: type II toxin-antitoxin system RelE/ParE family toxin, partial [Deltaproteobacteria bacterium]